MPDPVQPTAPASQPTGTMLDTQQGPQTPIPFTDEPSENSNDSLGPTASPAAPDPAQTAATQPPQQGQSQSGPQQGQPQQGGPTSTPDANAAAEARKQAGAAGVPATPPPAPPPPGVQRAGILHSIAQALAGGPRYKTTIDPNTGETKQTLVPMSRGDIGMAIVAEVLGGAMSGLGVQAGPGHDGRAAAAGFNWQQKQAQEQSQQQQQQANEDYARSAAITNANFTTHANALKMSLMDKAYHDQFVSQQKPILDNLTDVGAITATNVRESDLMPKFHITKDMAVADGVVPRMDPVSRQQAKNKDGSDAWDNTYSVIDPKANIQLPEETQKFLADHMVKGFFKTVDGKPQPLDLPADTRMRASFVVAANAAAQSVKLTEDSINNQLKGLGSEGDKDSQQFEVNLKKALASGDLSPDAMKSLSQYARLPLDQIADAMMKDKVKPDIIAQVRSILPSDAVETMKQDRVAAEAKNKERAVIDTDAKANSVLGDPTSTPLQKQEAQAFLKTDIQHAARKGAAVASADETARLDAKDANSAKNASQSGKMVDMVKDPAIAKIVADPNEVPVNGVNQGYLTKLQQVNPAFASELQAINEGRLTLSDYGLAKNDGQVLASYVTRAFPGYNQQKGAAYKKALLSFTSGDDAKQIEAANTTMLHAARFYQNAGSPMASIPGTTSNIQLSMDRPQLVEEINSAYTKGVLHDDKRKQLESDLQSSLPYKRQTAAKEVMTLLSDKVQEKQRTFQRAKPSLAVPDFPMISKESQDAFNSVTGHQIGENGLGDNQPQTPPQQAKQTPAQQPLTNLQQNAQGVQIGWDGKQYVDAKTRQPYVEK
jgi:hypothetical protein